MGAGATRLRRGRRCGRYSNPNPHPNPNPNLNPDPDQVRAVFERFDANRSGRLDYSELRNCLHALGVDVTPPEAAEVLAHYDADHSGLMELDEFANLAHSLGYQSSAAGEGGGWRETAAEGGGGWRAGPGEAPTRHAGELSVRLGGVP